MATKKLSLILITFLIGTFFVLSCTTTTNETSEENDISIDEDLAISSDENKGFILLKNVHPNSTQEVGLIDALSQNRLRWIEVIKSRENESWVIAEQCNKKPAVLHFNVGEQDGFTTCNISDMGNAEYLEKENIMDNIEPHEFSIELVKKNNFENEGKVQLFFEAHPGSKSANGVASVAIVIQENYKEDRRFVPILAKDNYKYVKVPCPGQNEDYPFLDDLLDKKWNSIYYSVEDEPILSDEIYTVFTNEDGYYFYSYSKICGWDEDMNWYSIDCDENVIPSKCLSFYLNEENILTVNHIPFCASVNDNLTQYYKLIE